MHLWNNYYNGLEELEKKGYFSLPYIPPYATNNAHMFYLVCNNLKDLTNLIQYLKNNGIQAVFHYLSLHQSPFYKDKHDGRELPNSDKFSDCLVHLPMFYDLTVEQQNEIIIKIFEFYDKKVYGKK